MTGSARTLQRMLAVLTLMTATAASAYDSGRAEMAAHLAERLCDKQVAVLAELPSHGEGQAFALKAAITQELVARCGFDAVLIEAPIYDFVALEGQWGTGTATQQLLDRAIGKFWWARELAIWRRWLFAEADAKRLRVAGIDDQVSATSEQARVLLPQLIATRSDGDCPECSEVCRAAVERHLYWRYDDTHPFNGTEQTTLLRCARAAAKDRAGDSVQQQSTDSAMANAFAGYVARQIVPDKSATRDDALAANASWHLARWPADTKVIIWTATVHGSKQQGALKESPMGKRLADRYGSGYGVIAFSAYSGQSSMAGRPATTFEPAPAQSLEGKATRADQRFAHLDAAALKELGEIDSRVFGKFIRADWSQFFDAVVVVREETPSQFEALE